MLKMKFGSGRFLLILIIFLAISFNQMTLLAGNGPCSATILDPSISDFQYFDNTGSTDSGVPPPAYGGYSGSDFWFSFEMPAGGLVNLILEGGSLNDPAIGIYAGPCDDPKLLYNILDDNCSDDKDPAAILDRLEPGEIYYIRVWAEDGGANGTFGIYLSETEASQPEFILYSDASESGDCIQLTDDINTQNGCAWFEIPIDFTQPFTHEMTANFGVKDANGADGICLIYQSNGPNYCGESGGGIGALGMPNSAIFEFDTYQNGEYNDPYNDHSAFNINGNMNHLFSLNGPVDLGNIEDGLDHMITFNYDGIGGYELLFDGILMFSGTYDFINNIFNGSTTAWWGYTAATGALNNEHIICPETASYELGTQEYLEALICPGESFNGYSDPGFYVDFVAGTGNCLHQVNTLVEVYPEHEPTYLAEYLCEGESLEINDLTFNVAGSYEIYAQDVHGCDSLILLDLTIPELMVEIIAPHELDCYNPEVELTVDIQSLPIYDFVDINWDTPTGYSNDWSYLATEPGEYYVTVSYYFEDLYCEASTIYFLLQDIEPPQITGLEDQYIDCASIDNINLLHPDVSGFPIFYDWYLNDSWIASSESVVISGPGNYVLLVENLLNGCTATDTAIVEYSLEFPTIKIFPETLNCEVDSFRLNVQLTGSVDSIYWFHDGIPFSSETSPVITSPGTYDVTLISSSNCITQDSIQILLDTLAPMAMAADQLMDCDENQIQLHLLTDSLVSVLWTGPEAILPNVFSPIVSTPGWYHFQIEDPYNHCLTSDSLLVSSLGNSPVIELYSGIIDCANPVTLIQLECDQYPVDTRWNFHGSLQDTSQNLTVSAAGWYQVEVRSQTGCLTIDSIEVQADLIHPMIVLSADTLNCDRSSAEISSEYFFADSLSWTGPDNHLYSTPLISTDIPGMYVLYAFNTKNGCSTTDSIELIDLTDYPDFTIAGDTLSCYRPEITLALELHSTVESVQWEFPDGSFNSKFQPIISEGGTYLLHIEVAGPCDIDTLVEIWEDLLSPEISVEGGYIDCLQTTTSIEIRTSEPQDQFFILGPSGQTYYSSQIDTGEPGTYQISVTGSNGCITKDSLEIKAYLEKPETQLQVEGPITCDLSEVLLQTSYPGDSINYTWHGPAQFYSTDTLLWVSKPGIYTLELVNIHGCKNTFSIQVEAKTDKPTVQLTGNNIDCLVPSAKLKFSSPDSISWARWTDKNGKVISDKSETRVNSGGWYYLEVINPYGCREIDSIYIASHTDEPEITVLSDNPLLVETYREPRAQLHVEVDSETAYQVSWIPAEGLSCSDCLSPFVLGNEVEHYSVRVTNAYGCTAEAMLEIRYKNKTIIEIPNVFTPNNQDGLNDYFSLFSNENVVLINDLMIYDRWGNLVAHQTNFPPNVPELGWDGRFRGQFAVKGVYVYYFKVTTIDEEILYFSGDITIL